MAEPVPVIPLEYERPSSDHQPTRPFLRNSIIFSWITIFLGTIAIWINVETAIVTGPLLFLGGALTIIAAFKPRRLPAITLGASHISVCLTFVILVNAFNWSPADAQVPFAILATAYMVGSCLYSQSMLGFRIVVTRDRRLSD
jgi:hypothetical protein